MERTNHEIELSKAKKCAIATAVFAGAVLTAPSLNTVVLPTKEFTVYADCPPGAMSDVAYDQDDPLKLKLECKDLRGPRTPAANPRLEYSTGAGDMVAIAFTIPVSRDGLLSLDGGPEMNIDGTTVSFTNAAKLEAVSMVSVK